MSNSKGLNELRDRALRIAVEHGFTEASPAEDIALMHSELSEALEDIRAGKRLAETTYTVKLGYGSSATETHADVSESRLHEMRVIEKQGGSPRVISAKPCGVPSELADVVIRVLHFAGKHGIDLERAVEEKMDHNESRPFRHGGKAL
jgi:NTP pyrophosphatase (non-canonical NTP hydrolase)